MLQTVVTHQEYKMSVLLHCSLLQMWALYVMSLICRGKLSCDSYNLYTANITSAETALAPVQSDCILHDHVL